MVKVVGKDEKHVHRVSCYGCASILEYTKSEVQEKTVSDYTGDRDIVKYIQCPNCSYHINVR